MIMAGGYYIPPGMTPEEVRKRRAMAEALMMEGTSAAPVGHWSQALARVAQGALGGYQMREANEAEQQGKRSAYAQALDLMGSGSGEGGGSPLGPDVIGPNSGDTANPGLQMAQTGNLQSSFAPPQKETRRGKIIAELLSNPWADQGLAQRLAMRELEPQEQWEQIQLGDGSLGQRNSRTGQIDVISRAREPMASYSTETDDQGRMWQINSQTGQRQLLTEPEPAPNSQYDQRLRISREMGMAEGSEEQNYFVQYGKPPPGMEGNEYGVTPVYGTDAQGNPVIVQVGKGGEAIQTKLPEGVRLSTGTEQIDLGTQWAIKDKKTGQIIGYQPKDLAGAESSKVVGKAQGEAIVNRDPAVAKGMQALDLVQQLRDHPGRELATGKSSFMGSLWGTQSYDFAKLNDQARGRAFLEAFESLKGGGQITQVEGDKATDAIARMDRAQTEEGYLQALNDFQAIVQTGIARAQSRPSELGASQGGGVGQPSPMGQGGGAGRVFVNPQTGQRIQWDGTQYVPVQ